MCLRKNINIYIIIYTECMQVLRLYDYTNLYRYTDELTPYTLYNLISILRNIVCHSMSVSDDCASYITDNINDNDITVYTTHILYILVYNI